MTPDAPPGPPGDEDIVRRQDDLARALDSARSSTSALQQRLATLERDYAWLAQAVALRARTTHLPASELSPPARGDAAPAPEPFLGTPAAAESPQVAPLAPPRPRPEVPAPPIASRRAQRPGALSRAVDRLVTADYADLFGARLLAWVGGAVTALGVVLLFAFAVNRGWITPGLRVAFGGTASAAVFAAGLALRRRFGTTYSTLGAVGAGVAGGYATLLAAAVLYDLVDGWAALGAAGAIAAVGTATAIAWRSELVAGIGLVGAMLVPLAAVPDTGVSALGTAFVALVLAGVATVATRLDWPRLLTVGTVVSAPQVAALLLSGDAEMASLVALAATFAALYAGAAIAFQVTRDRTGLSRLPASLVLTSAGVASLAAARLTGDGLAAGVDESGLVFGLIALAYGAAAAVLYALARARSLGVLFAAVALGLGGHALAELLSGRTLAVAFAIQAVLLAWLARRVADRRFQLGSLGYLGLAAAHALVVDAPPEAFADPELHPAFGAPSVLAAALGALGVARFAGAWAHREDGDGGPLAFVEHAGTVLGRASRAVRWALYGITGLAAAYAGSLAVLEAAQLVGDDLVASFQWGHVAVSVLVAGAALTALAVPRLWWTPARIVALLALFAAAAAKAALFDLDRLTGTPQGVALLAVGVILAVGALAIVLRAPAVGAAAALVVLALAVPLEVTGVLALVGDASWRGADGPGLALGAVAAGHALLAALAFARSFGRDHASAQGAAALGLGIVAIHELVDGTPRTLALAVLGALLAVLALGLRERRLLAGALTATGLGGVYALILEAPPGDLFAEQLHPGRGVPALVAGLAAAAAIAAAERGTAPEPRRLPEALERVVERWRGRWLWALGTLTVYAASLGVLELAELFLTGTVEADFQRGHTVVSAFWALVGVALLHTGLTRRRRALRAAGFAALGATLVKIFVYDLAALSAAARSVSFLAVGALLLVAGFVYQRLAAAAVERHTESAV